jgi:Ner family transcriptional regulator
MSKKKDWMPERLLSELRKRGVSFSHVDRVYGLSRRVCWNAAIVPNAKGEAALSDFLGVPAHLIWPGRFDTKGNRLKPQPFANYHRRPILAITRRAA